jgi:hypothetical protein
MKSVIGSREMHCWDLTSVRRRNVTSSVEEDRDIDIANPAIGVAAIEKIHEYRDNRLDTQ